MKSQTHTILLAFLLILISILFEGYFFKLFENNEDFLRNVMLDCSGNPDYLIWKYRIFPTILSLAGVFLLLKAFLEISLFKRFIFFSLLLGLFTVFLLSAKETIPQHFLITLLHFFLMIIPMFLGFTLSMIVMNGLGRMMKWLE